MAEETSIEEENNTDPGLAVLDLRPGAEQIIRLGGRIAVDARSKRVAGNRFWVNPREDHIHEWVIRHIRRVLASCRRYNEPPETRRLLVGNSLIDSMRYWGFKFTNSAKVLGSVPKNWLTDSGNPRYYYDERAWEDVKGELLDLQPSE